MKRDYDSTVARMAGNIAAGLITRTPANQTWNFTDIASEAVGIARAIIAEVKATEPDAGDCR